VGVKFGVLTHGEDSVLFAKKLGGFGKNRGGGKILEVISPFFSNI
jgi:hypothetical protein